jgi:hypothetical protein
VEDLWEYPQMPWNDFNNRKLGIPREQRVYMFEHLVSAIVKLCHGVPFLAIGHAVID